MSHLLDTNICAAHFRRPAGLAHRFFQFGGGLFVPTIVLGKLYAGAYHVANPTPLLLKIADHLIDVQVLDFDQDCAESFGKIRGSLLRKGISIPTADLMIGESIFICLRFCHSAVSSFILRKIVEIANELGRTNRNQSEGAGW